MSRLFPQEDVPMNAEELVKFKQLLAAYDQALRLQRMRERTIETYRQYLWKAAKHFNRCPDNLSADELKSYFAWMLSCYAPNTVNVQVASLVFLYRHVLNREVEWRKIIKQKGPKSLPDIPTREEVHFIINSVRKLRFRIFLLVVYSLGLRTTECLKLEVGDVDGSQHRVHIRDSKGGKDRYVVLPELTLQALRRFWTTHRHPRLLFPSPVIDEALSRRPGASMDASSVQAAFRATLRESGIQKRLTIRSLRHAYATHLLELGMDMRLIQDLMGHEDSKTTARYAHITKPCRDHTADRLQVLLEGFNLRWDDQP
jgi:integrase/recombinase XerD